MKRKDKENKRPTGILTSDWHLREDQPVCRVDDFWQAQWKAVQEIHKLQKEFNCPVLHAGDLFHHWKPSPNLLSETMNFIPDEFCTIYGQHDLPQHNMELAYKSGINTLVIADRLQEVKEANFGEEPTVGSLLFQNIEGVPPDRWIQQPIENQQIISNKRIISIWHKFVWDGEELPWPGCEESTAEQVLDKYPDFDLIVTGDYHKGFTHEKDGRLLVNPGCLTRQVADYKDYRPRVYLWYAEDNTVEPVYLPVEKEAVTREHIEQKENHNHRIEAFVERLSDEWETSVSFEENMRRFLSNNDIQNRIKEIIEKAIEK